MHSSSFQNITSFLFLDGFRYDYAKRYHADHLLTLAAQGASAPEGMFPA
jgi:hypothetical protein